MYPGGWAYKTRVGSDLGWAYTSRLSFAVAYWAVGLNGCLAQGMDDWASFSDIKNDLDWDETNWDAEVGYTTMYYSTGDGDDDKSDEITMEEVMELYDADVITDETMVFCDGMEGWDTFAKVKFLCEWPGDGEEEEGTPPDELYYEHAEGENTTVTMAEARALVAAGTITAETKVWADNLTDWSKLSDVATQLGIEMPAAGPEPEPEPVVRRPRSKTQVGRPRSKSRVVRTTGGKTIKVGGFKKMTANHSNAMTMTNAEQAEFFLRKFNRHEDINRPKIMILKKEFVSAAVC